MFTVDPVTYVISIPKSSLTLVSGTLYALDTNTFRLALKAWEASEEGVIHPKTHDHNTEVTVVGVTYARTIVILPPYSVEFEDDQYTVILTGSNNNIFDVANGILVQNQVQVIPTNAAGLITTVAGGSDLSLVLDQLTSIQASLVTLQSTVTAVQTSVDGVQTDVDSVQTIVDAVRDLAEADQFFDHSEGRLHTYRRGTTTPLIPAKVITGTGQAQDATAQEE